MSIMHIVFFIVLSFLFENIGGFLDFLFSGYFDGTGRGVYAFFLSYLYLVVLSLRRNKKYPLLLPIIGFLIAFITKIFNQGFGIFHRSYGLLNIDHFYFYLTGGVFAILLWGKEKK